MYITNNPYISFVYSTSTGNAFITCIWGGTTNRVVISVMSKIVELSTLDERLVTPAVKSVGNGPLVSPPRESVALSLISFKEIAKALLEDVQQGVFFFKIPLEELRNKSPEIDRLLNCSERVDLLKSFDKQDTESGQMNVGLQQKYALEAVRFLLIDILIIELDDGTRNAINDELKEFRSTRANLLDGLSEDLFQRAIAQMKSDGVVDEKAFLEGQRVITQTKEVLDHYELQSMVNIIEGKTVGPIPQFGGLSLVADRGQYQKLVANQERSSRDIRIESIINFSSLDEPVRERMIEQIRDLINSRYRSIEKLADIQREGAFTRRLDSAYVRQELNKPGCDLVIALDRQGNVAGCSWYYRELAEAPGLAQQVNKSFHHIGNTGYGHIMVVAKKYEKMGLSVQMGLYRKLKCQELGLDAIFRVGIAPSGPVSHYNRTDSNKTIPSGSYTNWTVLVQVQPAGRESRVPFHWFINPIDYRICQRMLRPKAEQSITNENEAFDPVVRIAALPARQLIHNLVDHCLNNLDGFGLSNVSALNALVNELRKILSNVAFLKNDIAGPIFPVFGGSESVTMWMQRLGKACDVLSEFIKTDHRKVRMQVLAVCHMAQRLGLAIDRELLGDSARVESIIEKLRPIREEITLIQNALVSLFSWKITNNSRRNDALFGIKKIKLEGGGALRLKFGGRPDLDSAFNTQYTPMDFSDEGTDLQSGMVRTGKALRELMIIAHHLASSKEEREGKSDEKRAPTYPPDLWVREHPWGRVITNRSLEKQTFEAAAARRDGESYFQHKIRLVRLHASSWYTTHLAEKVKFFEPLIRSYEGRRPVMYLDELAAMRLETIDLKHPVSNLSRIINSKLTSIDRSQRLARLASSVNTFCGSQEMRAFRNSVLLHGVAGPSIFAASGKDAVQYGLSKLVPQDECFTRELELDGTQCIFRLEAAGKIRLVALVYNESVAGGGIDTLSERLPIDLAAPGSALRALFPQELEEHLMSEVTLATTLMTVIHGNSSMNCIGFPEYELFESRNITGRSDVPTEKASVEQVQIYWSPPI